MDYISTLASKKLITEQCEELTFDEAFNKLAIRRKATTPYNNSIPNDFREFVLRKWAVSERGCRHFEKQLHPEARNYLKRLVGLKNSDISLRRVHQKSTVKPNGFLGILVRYFFKKLVFDVRNQTGRYEYAENYAEIFPFPVTSSVPSYDAEVGKLFNEDFYTQMQTFLDKHFDGVRVRSMCSLFLANIYHFQVNNFSEEALMSRLQNMCGFTSAKDKTADYLDTFPRLNEQGIKWFHYLYNLFKIIKKIYHNVDESVSGYNDDYFQSLPESNFADLYELLKPQFFTSRPQEYIQRFQKYIFFFIHALDNDSTPIFFIDDVLFECLKSLHRCKTIHDENLTLIGDLAMLSLVHLRTKAEIEDSNNDYRIESAVLGNIKNYVLNFPNIENAQIDIEVKTDYLHGWMLLRTNDTCFEMCYSTWERKHINNFLDRILCSSLCSDDEPIKYIVFYNAYWGQESSIVRPRNIDRLRDFVRVSNNYDFSQKIPNDEFLTKDLERYFVNMVAH